MALFIAALPAIGFTQVVFTFNATVNSDEDPTALGYTVGQSVTFSYTLNHYAPTAPVGGVSGDTYYEWTQNPSGPQLWQNVSGTGLTGSWVQPSTPSHLIFARQSYDGSSELWIVAGSEEADDMGISAGGHGLERVIFNANFEGLLFATPGGELPDPTSYFQDYVGTYATSSHVNARVASFEIYDEDLVIERATFTIDSLTISYTPMSAVPEPSSYAALAGVCALGFAAWRRRRGSGLRASASAA